MNTTIERSRRVCRRRGEGTKGLYSTGMKGCVYVLFASVMLLAACDVKDPIFNTSHPDHGMVTLTTDWSGIGEGLSVPESYSVTTGADYTATLTGITNRLDHLFAPGDYCFLVYNTAEQITVDGTVASVEQEAVTPMGAAGTFLAESGADEPERFIHGEPGWLFTCALDATIERDTEHSLTAVMQQQVRQLTLIIEPAGGTTDRIERIEGYLSGVAGTLNIDNGTHATPANVMLRFSKIASGDNAGKWSATVRLLGVTGEEQRLFGLISFSEDSPMPVFLDSDLTDNLRDFNANKRTPLTLGGKIVETPTEVGFSATINDWIPVTGSGTAD